MEHPIALEGLSGDGVEIGGKRYTRAVLKALNAAEIVEVAEAAEVLRFLPVNGESTPVLVQSPSRTNREHVCRMIARLENDGGETHPGPLQAAWLKLLSSKDYERCLDAIGVIDKAAANALTGVEERGRDDGAGGDR